MSVARGKGPGKGVFAAVRGEMRHMCARRVPPQAPSHSPIDSAKLNRRCLKYVTGLSVASSATPRKPGSNSSPAFDFVGGQHPEFRRRQDALTIAYHVVEKCRQT